MASHVDAGKPTNPNHLVLEAWSQGMMVGSLIVMAMITTANMRTGVLLHKLVLLEVRTVSEPSRPTESSCAYWVKLFIAGPRSAKWFLHLLQIPGFRLVSFVYRCLAYRIVEFAQCHCVD